MVSVRALEFHSFLLSKHLPQPVGINNHPFIILANSFSFSKKKKINLFKRWSYRDRERQRLSTCWFGQDRARPKLGTWNSILASCRCDKGPNPRTIFLFSPRDISRELDWE